MENLNYTIVKKSRFYLAGYTDTFTYVGKKENYKCIAQKWANLSDGEIEKMVPLMNGLIPAFIGCSDPIDNKYFRYTIAVSTDISESKEFHITKIPETNWLIFPCIGDITSNSETNSMIILKNRVLGDWLDEKNFVHADCPRIEIYPKGDMSSKNYRSELWVPILNKS